jgi:hypothetical protein
MSQKTIKIERIPVTEPNKFIDVSVDYTDRRGIYLDARIAKVEDGLYSTVLTEYDRRLLEPRKRHSLPALKHWAEKIKEREVYQEFIQGLATRYGLTIANAISCDETGCHYVAGVSTEDGIPA